MTEAQGANYRKIFMAQFSDLPRDVRASAARTAENPALYALCYDPDPMVINSLLNNMMCGLEHARLIAAHHQHSAGLSKMAEKAQFARDSQVRRFLLRNVQTPETVLRKILNPLALRQVYQANLSRENSERAKRILKKTLRTKFQQSSAEERVNLITKTEARCLNMLVGLNFDNKTTALLCRRAYHSSLAVQNFARFPATPPALIKHLLRQQIVRRTPVLRQKLTRHANCPSDLKRAQ